MIAIRELKTFHFNLHLPTKVFDKNLKHQIELII